MPFTVFRILFLRSTRAALYVAIKKSIMLETYHQSQIEQLGRCTLKIRYDAKCVKCRFFVVPGDSPALPGIPGIEQFGIIRVLCGTIDIKTINRKFDAQTKHAADSQNCKTNSDTQVRSDVDNTNGDKTNIPDYLNSRTNKTHMSDYFHSNDNKEADKRVSEAITNRKKQ